MGLPDTEISELSRGGLVHDIGKLATPPGILDKEGTLTPEEFAIMREHPRKGVHILEPIPAFGPLLPIVGQHHERWDGAGYPDGLGGEQIARTARVLAVADVWDALSSDRPYRKGLPIADVVRMISAGAGSQFDPRAVDAFVRVMARTVSRTA
jgi:HD-GYP domain-containing protein (c-di-GMP phosphodiesterase class II)